MQEPCPESRQPDPEMPGSPRSSATQTAPAASCRSHRGLLAGEKGTLSSPHDGATQAPAGYFAGTALRWAWSPCWLLRTSSAGLLHGLAAFLDVPGRSPGNSPGHPALERATGHRGKRARFQRSAQHLLLLPQGLRGTRGSRCLIPAVLLQGPAMTAPQAEEPGPARGPSFPKPRLFHAGMLQVFPGGIQVASRNLPPSARKPVAQSSSRLPFPRSREEDAVHTHTLCCLRHNTLCTGRLASVNELAQWFPNLLALGATF